MLLANISGVAIERMGLEPHDPHDSTIVFGENVIIIRVVSLAFACIIEMVVKFIWCYGFSGDTHTLRSNYVAQSFNFHLTSSASCYSNFQ